MKTGAGLVLHQLRLEQRSFWRNPDTAFFTFALPVGLLLIFGFTAGDNTIPGRDDISGLTLFVPGILAFGIIVAAYGSLAATIAVLRSDGVLKRIRATPLPSGTYLAGHLLSVLTTSLVIALVTVALGRVAFGVAPRTSWIPALVVALALAIVCFASLGLAISAFIPTAAAAGPITNGTYLPLALVSGTFSGSLELPSWLDHAVSLFPVRALTDAVKAAYDPAVHGWPAGSLLVLAVWTVAGIAVALRYFRWEPTR
jgi:ABC-2 type transport system permease protein